MFEQNQRQAVASSCISKRSDRKPFILPGERKDEIFQRLKQCYVEND